MSLSNTSKCLISGTVNGFASAFTGTNAGGITQMVGGPPVGSLQVLPTPVRIYDSRPGTSPPNGLKTPLGGTPRTLDATVNGSGVPVGASAVAVTCLLVNAAVANANFTIWAGGIAQPAANTLVWGGDAGRFTTSAITALSPTATLQVAASSSTDLVLDVVGYYT